jgi:ParB-like chromosome segregation protein Spo0J
MRQPDGRQKLVAPFRLLPRRPYVPCVSLWLSFAMDYQVADKIVPVPLRELRESPQQKHVHADFDPDGKDKWFVEDIRRHGVLVPLIIMPDKTVKEGHRRMWAARLVGKTEVPCLLLSAGDPDAVMLSAVMHRQLSLYTKCLAYRDKIEALTQAGKAAKQSNLKQFKADAGTPANIEQGWIEIEEVLAVRRDQVQAGVALLARLEALEAAKKPDERDRAKRIIGVFRNRGLKPALRLMDPRTSDEIAESFDAAPEAPDCNNWETQANKTGHRRAGQIAGRASAAKRQATSPFTPGKPLLTKLFGLLCAYESFLDTLPTAPDLSMVRAQRWEPTVAQWFERMQKATQPKGDKLNGNVDTTPAETTPTVSSAGPAPSAAQPESPAKEAGPAAAHEPERKAKVAAQNQSSHRRERGRVSPKAKASTT